MPTALLAGAFGQGNLGDDALLDAFVTALPEWRVVATAADPVASTSSGCSAVAARRPATVAARALRCDAVVVGGGTLYKRLHPDVGRPRVGRLANTAALVAGASAIGRPVALVGVGAEPFTDRGARRLARFVVRHANLMVLRDEETAAELAAAGAPGPYRVGADPAWTLLGPPSEGRAVGARRVLVIPSSLAMAGDGRAGMVARLARTVDRLASEGVDVVVQPFQRATADGEGDETLVAELAGAVGGEVELLPPATSLADASSAMGAMGAVLTFRFHGLVAAAAAGVPVVAIGHEAKLRGLARRLGQRSAPAGFAHERLAAQVHEALASEGPPPSVVKEEIARAEEGFRLLRVVLGDDTSAEADTLGTLPLAPWPR